MNFSLEIETKGPSCWEKISQFEIKRRCVTDSLYVEGNKLCHSVLGKKPVIIFDNEDFLHESVKKFDCHIPGCVKSFDTLLEYEGHYSTAHRFVCGTCNKRLPSPHLLDLHVSEAHDSYFAALAERKPMFKCFVETCDAVYSTTKERRSHCIEIHQFPPNFRYDVEKKESTGKSTKQEDNSSPNKKEKSPKGKTAPKCAGFGHGASRSFFRGRGRGGHYVSKKSAGKQSDEKDVSMVELEEALPDV